MSRQIMKVIAMLQPAQGTKPEDLRAHLVEEKVVWDLYKADTIREMYFRGDGRGAVFILESASVEAASEFSKLPMVRDGLLQAEFIPLSPFANLSLCIYKISRQLPYA